MSEKVPAFDALASFANWFVREQGHRLPVCIFDGVTRVGQFSGLVLYRNPPYQVQLWIADPNAIIPEHTHPNMDTILVYLSGQLYLIVNNTPIFTLENLIATENGLPSQTGAFIRIGPTDKHSAVIGPKGGAFLNFGLFLDGKPRSANEDWIGEPLASDGEFFDKCRENVQKAIDWKLSQVT